MRSLPGFDSTIARRLLRLLQLRLGKVPPDASQPSRVRLCLHSKHMKDLLRAACSSRIASNALRISLVVGTVLNLVNQGDAIFAGSGVSWPPIFLNYLVPYLVASYSAAKNQTAYTKDHTPCQDR